MTGPAGSRTPSDGTGRSIRIASILILLAALVVGIYFGARAISGSADVEIEQVSQQVEVVPSLEARRGVPLPAGAALERIAFGSCSRTDLPQPLWDPILAADPQVWIWLGDNIYGDSPDASVLRAKYDRQLQMPGYEALLEAAAVVGTWDDHDFGANNGGSEHAGKVESQAALLDFLGEPEDSPRRRQEGIYAAYTWGPPGRRVKLILLDARYHRDARGSDGTILGEAQWAWLEDELHGSDAQLHLIVSGIQVLHEEHRYERWSEFPTERSRLFELIARTGAPGVILLSGDRHISEIARLPAGTVGYPLWEITSSGMTHSWSDNPGEPNRYRVGELYKALGFGTIEIDWAAGQVALQLRDPANEVAVEQVVSLEELQPREAPAAGGAARGAPARGAPTPGPGERGPGGAGGVAGGAPAP